MIASSEVENLHVIMFQVEADSFHQLHNDCVCSLECCKILVPHEGLSDQCTIIHKGDEVDVFHHLVRALGAVNLPVEC